MPLPVAAEIGRRPRGPRQRHRALHLIAIADPALGIDAAVARRRLPNSARKRIFDGAAEAKLIALACSPPPKGRKQ